MNRFIGACIVVAATLLVACPESPAQGDEGAACFPNGTCNDSLVCLSDLCVDESSTGEGEGEATGEGEGESAGEGEGEVTGEGEGEVAGEGEGEAAGEGEGEGDCPPTQVIALDGIDGELSVADSPLLSLAADFTVELWVRLDDIDGVAHLVGHDQAPNANKWILGYGPAFVAGARTLWFHTNTPSSGNGTVLFNHEVAFAVGEWHHVAVSRSGSTARLFVDGVLAVTDTLAGPLPESDQRFTVGSAENGGFVDGHLAEVRLSSVARYAADFTPGGRLAADASTIALWHLDEQSGPTAFDSSGNGLDLTLNGGASFVSDTPFCVVDEGVCSAGRQVVLLDGIDDELSVGDSPLLSLPGDFTAELWVRLSQLDAVAYFMGHDQAPNANKWMFGYGPAFVADARTLWFHTNTPSGGNGTVLFNHPVAFAVDEWHHVAVARSGSTIRLFVDGERAATDTLAGALPESDQRFTVGSAENGGFVGGALAEARLSSVARYATSFTPAVRLATDAATIALWHLDEAGGIAAADSSGNGLDLTLLNGASFGADATLCSE